MLPIWLAVSAAGAVLELKRFVHRGDGAEAELDDAQVDKEEKLKEMLTVRCCRLWLAGSGMPSSLKPGQPSDDQVHRH